MEAIIVNNSETRRKANNNNNNNFNEVSLLHQLDGYRLGRSFLYELNQVATEEGAYDSWVNKHRALTQFCENHKFFRSLLISVGKEMNNQATWIKLARSRLMVLMSINDVGTDVYTILYVGERAVRTPAGATTGHFRIARFSISWCRVATHCLC